VTRAFAAADRLLRGLLALAVLFGLLGGVPWLLVWFIGWPLPDHMPGLGELGTALTTPLDDRKIFSLLAVLAWALWLLFVRDVLAEAITAATEAADARRGRSRPPRQRPIGPVRLVAALLVGAIAGAVLFDSLRGAVTSRATGAAAAANAAHTPAVAVAPVRAQPVEMVDAVDAVGPRPAVAAPVRPSIVANFTAPSHTTQSLTGQRVTDQSGHLNAGQREPDVSGWAQDAPGGIHRVVKGDNLWDIAKHELGDPFRWRDIYVLNRDKPQFNGYALTDPDEIHIGWVLVLPARTPGTPPAGVASGTPVPANPPPQNPPPANPAPSTPTGRPPASPAPATSLPASPAPANPAPQPTTVDPANPSALAPSSTPAPPPHPTGAQPTPQHSEQDGGEDSDSEHGVSLPSQGWVSLGLAATIAVAAALLRLQRRRRARLRFPIPVRTGPQPAPVPPSLSTVDAAGSRLLDLDTGDSALPGVVPAPQTVPAPVGVDEHGGEVSLFELPGPGVALDGPGAVPAARAILAAVLSTGLVAHLADRAIVVTSADTLARLLPPGAPPVGINTDRASFDGERLIVLPDTAAVVTYGEEEMIHRRRLLDSMGMDTVAALNARNDHLENQTQCVLLRDADPRHAARLRAVAAHRDALWLHPVILGRHDGIPTLDVDRDGTVLTAEAQPSGEPALPVVRLATLAGRDLVDVLALVAEVAPRHEEGTDIDQAAQAAHANTEPNAGTPEDHPIDAAGIGGVEVDPAALGGSSGDAAAEVEIPARNGDTVPLARLSVLGPLTVATDAGTVGAGMRSGSYGVLAMLAAHPSGRTREQLAAALYPTVNPELADNRVRTDTTTARRVLRQATGHNEAKFILYDAGTGLYRLDPDIIDVDLWRMLTAIQAANTATDDTECLAALRQAAGCYGGEFAQGQDRAWALDYATTYRHQVLGAYARIAEILEADHPDQAIAALETAINLDPVNEELYQRLMRIHGRLGRPDAVRRTLRLLEDRLADLGEAEPSEATRRVAVRQLKPTLTRPR
jgi:DNA-binding SARP family transcriptional activator